MPNVEPGDSQTAIQLLREQLGRLQKQRTAAENVAALVAVFRSYALLR